MKWDNSWKTEIRPVKRIFLTDEGKAREDSRRRGHVALEHEEAVRINEAMKDRGIVRYPNVIRLAPVALYISYHDVWKVVQIIKEIMKNEVYKNYSKERGVVA